MFTRARGWALFVLLLASPFGARAQSFTPESTTARVFESESIVVNVDVVNVFFNVRKHSRIVDELKPDEFELFEDKRPQAIRYFSAESQQPLTLAILLDSSSSQSTVLNQQLEVGKRFLRQVLRPEDEALVLGFDSRMQVYQEFTHSTDNLVAALARGLQGTTEERSYFGEDSIPNERSTALYDAIVAVSKLRMQQHSGHKAMLILTDGQDMGSRHTAEQAIEAAQRSDSICYVLLIGDKDEMAMTQYRGAVKMEELAKATGGQMIMVKSDTKKLERSFNQISEELRHFYSLAYVSDRKEKSGEYRKISLRSRHHFDVQARKGYYAVQRKAAPLEAMR